jgi:hypothetical protein
MTERRQNLHKVILDKLIHLTCEYFFIGKPKQMNQLKLAYPLNKLNSFSSYFVLIAIYSKSYMRINNENYIL